VALLLGQNQNQQCNILDRKHNQQTQQKLLPSMKEFYFVFGQTWLEFCIAGRTQNPTLVGLHGHVFDMTSFLHQHPGSSETIIMQGAGKDSTAFFEAVGHSKQARSLAMLKLVEVIDLSCCKGDVSSVSSRCGLVRSVTCILDILPQKRTNKKLLGPGTLVQLRRILDKERHIHERVALSTISCIMAKKGELDMIGNVNIFFDPLCFCWKAWYLNLDFEPVFLHNIHPTTTVAGMMMKPCLST
jgi:hypothetical protein